MWGAVPVTISKVFYRLHKSSPNTTVICEGHAGQRWVSSCQAMTCCIAQLWAVDLTCPLLGQFPPHSLHFSFISVVLSCQEFLKRILWDSQEVRKFPHSAWEPLLSFQVMDCRLSGSIVWKAETDLGAAACQLAMCSD